jgi:hypothetical protein
MNALEQTKCYLMQYVRSQKTSPWLARMNEAEDRARWALQHLGGMAGDWDTNRAYCYYYYSQQKQK